MYVGRSPSGHKLFAARRFLGSVTIRKRCVIAPLRFDELVLTNNNNNSAHSSAQLCFECLVCVCVCVVVGVFFFFFFHIR